jgi:hypothetical protein
VTAWLLLSFADVVQRSQLEGQRKADFQALAAAKRSGNLAIVNFVLELPAELADVELPEKSGIIEVPVTGDVPMLKRLFMYQAHNKLLPALQVSVLAGADHMDGLTGTLNFRTIYEREYCTKGLNCGFVTADFRTR